ncbi:probable E3 ubiquitin-protein ligase HERC3 isoform X2 [Megalobrama amblycephala]|uniref:probable E3 ubiquitin-protein ligase HERC3 isoform X2 n=1 Tax=Megalobrama amblycephala TaxID=75352 RepID=UPI002013F889|nr:probable E3 ubiquitin-protein ligase HERC3 isoform X2 [Megalobrama amblycephala]
MIPKHFHLVGNRGSFVLAEISVFMTVCLQSAGDPSAVNMLCCWGAPVREGFGLLKPDKVKHGNYGIRSMCPETAVEDMSAGRSFVGFIRDGKVSVLRLRNEDYDHDGELEQLQLMDDRIRSIVCGGADAVLLADAGRVLVMDKSTVCQPLKVLENRQVIQITCGDQHSMALTNDGQLFVWGENSHGQLGLGKGEPSTPQPLKSLCGIPLAQISAGGDHSFVLSLSGVVFGWGKNSAGQLGLGDTTDRHVPTVVNSLNRKKTVSISCGGEHTATLSKGGTVFTFGSGGFGQLGHNSFKDEHHPRVVAELWGSKVSLVTCGRRHTLVSVSSSKLIYSFGCGMQGQLGNGEMIKQSVPLPVDLSNECDHEYMIEKLIAGENHSFALFFKEHESKPKSGVLTLNDKTIDRWVFGSDSWVTIKEEINTVFSSAASLNGSFLKTRFDVTSCLCSCDEHYQTSVENCGLDFDLVKTSFAKLLENKRSISEVVKVVQQKLLPSLSPNSNPTCVESLRLYLLLPELIRGLQKQRTELTEAISSKIIQLNPAAAKMLEMYWSKLPDDWLKGLVKLFHKESAELIGQISCGETGHDLNRRLQNFLQILQMLYEVCCSTHNDITNSDFIIHEVNDLLDTLQVTLDDLAMILLGLRFTDFNDLVTLKDYYLGIIEILVKFPFAADILSKQRMFCYLQMRLQFSPDQDMLMLNDNVLSVKRESLLTDTLKYLRQNTHSFYYPLKVVFIGENGIDWRGLSAEFFTLLSQSLLKWEKKVLEVQENSLVWFNPDHTQGNKDFYYLGVICGMALYNHHYMDINFPLALYKKLLKLSPTLNDLEELSPVEAGNLKNLLEEDEDVVDILFLNFTVKGQELIPKGGQIQVNKVNRQKYVDLYVDFVFNKSVKNQFKHFSRGFSKGCPLKIWSMFHPEELQELLQGSPKYEWQELQTSASYESCSASDELIKNFWTVFFEFSEENKKKFLMFLYGRNRVPVGGFSMCSLKICQSDGPDPDDRLPEAQTCFGRLILPKYSDINTLRNKLVHAINFCKVFGRE